MKKRQIPGMERLEARETPDVSLGAAATCSFVPLPAQLLVVGTPPGQASPLVSATEQSSATAALTASERTDDGSLSLPALDTFFADSAGLDHLLAEDLGLFSGNGTSPRPARLHDSEYQGLHFLRNYTRKAIRNEEARFGGLVDHEDLEHQVFVEWWEQVQPQERALVSLLSRDSAERALLRKTVRRVLDHVRYEQNRAKRTVGLFDVPAPTRSGEQDWIDLHLDWAQGDSGLGPRERQVLELRRQGMTFQEIGDEMGLVKQRVCEMFNAAVAQLQELYAC
jgi:hypothetical protein